MKQRGLSCLLALSLLLLALPAVPASAASIYGLTLTAFQGGVAYAFESDEDYVMLTYASSMETGKTLLHSPEGYFTGEIALPCTVQPERLKVEFYSLKGDLMLTERVTTEYNPQETHYADHPVAAKETALRARNLVMTPYPGGVQIDFDFPGYDLVNVSYRTGQQTGTLPFYADEDYHYCCRIDLPLTYAGSGVKAEIYLPRKDDPVGKTEGTRGYTLEARVTEPAEEGRLKGLLICIDPGHGDVPGTCFEPVGPEPEMEGYYETSPSLCGRGHFTYRRESIVVLEIAYLLRDELRRQGAEVIMTREDEETWITSVPRAEIANEAGADFMIRLHADDREDDENIRGVQVFCPLSSPYAKALCTAKEYRAMGEALMYAIRDGCGYPEKARGNMVVLNDRYVGNNWAKMPCFLIEMGFLSNRQDDLTLSHPDFQQLMAESISEGIYQMALLRGLIEW